MAKTPSGRREVLKKAAYLAPVIISLPILPSFGQAGSGGGGGMGMGMGMGMSIASAADDDDY